MFSLSKIKNIKNVLIIVVLLPTSNYSMDLLVPKLIPRTIFLVCAIADLGVLGKQLLYKEKAIEGLNNVIVHACRFATYFTAYQLSNSFTAEYSLNQAQSILDENEKLMKTGKLKSILTLNSNDLNFNNIDTIIKKNNTDPHAIAQFIATQIQPLMDKITTVERLNDNIKNYIEDIQTNNFSNKIHNQLLFEKKYLTELLESQENEIAKQTQQLKAIADKLIKNTKYNHTNDHSGWIGLTNKKAQTKFSNAKLNNISYQNSFTIRLFNLIFSNPVLINSIYQIVLTVINKL